MATYVVPSQKTNGTREHISRASYFWVGPGSPPNRQYPLKDRQGLNSGPDVGAKINWITNANLQSPATASTTYVVNAQAVAGAGAVTTTTANNTTVTGLNGGNPVVTLDVPRALQYVSSNSGDTTQTVTVSGYDQYKQAMTEVVTLNGVTAVIGKKAFVYVSTVTASAALTGNLSVGTSNVLGLPMAVDAGDYDAAVKVISAAQTADAGTLVFADRTTPATTSTGDVRGTYTPAAAPNGTTQYLVRYYPSLGLDNTIYSTYGLPNV